MISMRLRRLYRRLSYLTEGLAFLPAWDAGAYPIVFQRFSEPVGVIAAIPEQPIDIGQAAQQRSGHDVVADLSCGYEQV